MQQTRVQSSRGKLLKHLAIIAAAYLESHSDLLPGCVHSAHLSMGRLSQFTELSHLSGFTS